MNNPSGHTDAPETTPETTAQIVEQLREWKLKPEEFPGYRYGLTYRALLSAWEWRQADETGTNAIPDDMSINDWLDAIRVADTKARADVAKLLEGSDEC